MTIVIIQRITAMVPMPVCASLGRARDRERGHRKGCNRSLDYDCLLHHRFSKTAPSQTNGIDQRHSFKLRSTRSPSAQFGRYRLATGPPSHLSAGIPLCAAAGSRPAWVRTDGTPSQHFEKSASLLTKREIFPQFECAQTIFLDFGRRPDQRKRRVRKLLPDSKIFRCNREPPEPEHVSARFGHSPDLSPCDLLDGPRAWSVRYSARAHFEGVEMQRQRRQRQPQISQFFGARVV